LWAFIGSIAVVGLSGLVLLTTLGVIRPWGGRFYSLWDTDYARKYIPIIASVSEHQPTPWTSFFFDLHFLVIFFPAGKRAMSAHFSVLIRLSLNKLKKKASSSASSSSATSTSLPSSTDSLPPTFRV